MKKTLTIIMLWGTALMAQNHALIIGCCSQYLDPSIPLLEGTSNDASHIRTLLLERAVRTSNMDYLIEKDATYQNITDKVKALEHSNLQKGDTLYVYYSGHGTSADDRGLFHKKLSGNADLLKRLNNSTGLIPYDFDRKNPDKTLIITSRDLRPTFETLDKRGINIVWIADACYAGNAYRSHADNGEKGVIIDPIVPQSAALLKPVHYKHLLFYGATLTDIMTNETYYHGEARGAFSVEVENCLNKPYPSGYITNQAFKNCLESSYAPFMFSSSIYPIGNQRSDQILLKASAKPGVDDTAHASFKEKLFALTNDQAPLRLNIYSQDASEQAIDTFCMGEILSIELKRRSRNVVALTLDTEDKLIMLYPNQHTRQGARLKKVIETEVQPPAGIDRIKLFSISDQKVYNTFFQHKNNPQGILSDAEIEILYTQLAQSQQFRTALVKVTTINKGIKTCLQGAR